jgi:hypothetical protein
MLGDGQKMRWLALAAVLCLGSGSAACAEPLAGMQLGTTIASGRIGGRIRSDRLGGQGAQELRDTAISTGIRRVERSVAIEATRQRSDTDALREKKTKRVASFR